MSYRPNPGTECCAGNVNRFMPNYIWNMYYQNGNDIYLNLYGASIYETKIDDKKIKIEQITKFPFEENITLKIETETDFNLKIRIPDYVKNVSILVDNQEVYNQEKNYKNIKISRNCSVFCNFESEIEERKTSETGVYFIKGPLVYSYGMFGNREIDFEEERSSKEFPAYNIYPDKPWGYEVKNDVNPKFYPGTAEIFDLRHDLPSIEINAYKIKEIEVEILDKIELEHFNLYGKKRIEILEGKFMFTPDLLKKDYEINEISSKIRLYPYGACKVRETVFRKKD